MKKARSGKNSKGVQSGQKRNRIINKSAHSSSHVQQYKTSVLKQVENDIDCLEREVALLQGGD